MSFIKIVEVDEEVTFEHTIKDSVFVLRQMDAAMLDKINKNATRRVWKRHQPEDDLDAFAFSAEVLDWGLVDWKNVKHPKTGADVPCDRENKLKLPISIQNDLRDLIVDGATEEDKKAAEKNSSASSAEGEVSPGPIVSRVHG